MGQAGLKGTLMLFMYLEFRGDAFHEGSNGPDVRLQLLGDDHEAFVFVAEAGHIVHLLRHRRQPVSM